jgi:hypothetical protein
LKPTVAVLDREIEREERLVGVRPHGPFTQETIHHTVSRRQAQVASVLSLVAIGLLGVAFSPRGSTTLRMLTVALAIGLVAYALEQDRHLRRLSRLGGDSQAITMAVANALATSGVLDTDDEVYARRAAFERAAPALAQGLTDVVVTARTRIRIAGPLGELPIAASYVDAASGCDDEIAAHEAVRYGRPAQQVRGEQTVLAVPLYHHGQAVAVVELTSPEGLPFDPGAAALVDAYARGALAALR